MYCKIKIFNYDLFNHYEFSLYYLHIKYKLLYNILFHIGGIYLRNDKKTQESSTEIIQKMNKLEKEYSSQNLRNLEYIDNVCEMQKRQLSPIYNLIKNNEYSVSDNIYKTSLFSNFNSSYEIYEKHRKNIQNSLKKQSALTDYLNNLESISQSLKSLSSPSPLELYSGITLPKTDYLQIRDELFSVDWDQIINESIISSEEDYSQINFVTKEPDQFALKLYGVVPKDDAKLSSVFTEEFLREIAKQWWILPRISLNEYEELSQKFDEEGNLDLNLLFDYYINPEHVYELLDNWEIYDENREKILTQSIDNYYLGNYEICVVTLLLQIEGLMRDKLKSKKCIGYLREQLEKKLNNLLDTGDFDNWDIFLINSSKEFIWMVLNPLSDNVHFIKDSDLINRNISAHNGKVEANQKIAIRLLLIIDTLMYLLELI